MSGSYKDTTEERQFLRQGKRGILRAIFGRTMLITVFLILNFLLTFSILFDWFQNIPLLFGSVEVFTAVMLVYVLNTRDNPSVKLTWAVIIAVVPLLGAVLYGFIQLDIGHRVNRRLIDSSIAASLPFLPVQELENQQILQNEPELYPIVRYLGRYANASVYGNTEVRYFPLGEDKFSEMLIQLEKAEKFIFLEYFLISEGYMWNTILEILRRKAAEGVEVRVLYDGMNAFYNLPYSYPAQLKKLGIQCKTFAPVRPFVSTHYNNRDHRKILIIDGHTAFTGGINLEDRYINREVVFGHWKDTAVMVQGDAAQGFTAMFLQMWNAGEKDRIFAPYLALPDASTPADGYVIPYGDTPTDSENVGKMVYLNLANQARNFLWIMTPYLILDNELSTALQFAAKRGVDVRLILPHIPDKRSAFALAKSHYPELLEAGVRIYEYTPGFIHAKVCLCDDIHAVVGTINLDYRSLYHHFECAAYLYRVSVLADIARDFRDTMAQSQEITLSEIKKRPILSRFIGHLLKVFAPLM